MYNSYPTLEEEFNQLIAQTQDSQALQEIITEKTEKALNFWNWEYVPNSTMKLTNLSATIQQYENSSKDTVPINSNSENSITSNNLISPTNYKKLKDYSLLCEENYHGVLFVYFEELQSSLKKFCIMVHVGLINFVPNSILKNFYLNRINHIIMESIYTYSNKIIDILKILHENPHAIKNITQQITFRTQSEELFISLFDQVKLASFLLPNDVILFNTYLEKIKNKITDDYNSYVVEGLLDIIANTKVPTGETSPPNLYTNFEKPPSTSNSSGFFNSSSSDLSDLDFPNLPNFFEFPTLLISNEASPKTSKRRKLEQDSTNNDTSLQSNFSENSISQPKLF